jgi:alpha-methylacyl-CoA racemase
MLLAFGVLAGIIEARTSGKGQVVDAAMVEGSALLMTMIWAMKEIGVWTEPGSNLLDSGAHFYETYRCKDGGHVAIGAIEPQFYAELLRLLEVDPADFPQMDRERWPELKLRFTEIFATKTREEWVEILEPAEACGTAVYGIDDAPGHPHNKARRTFVEVGGKTQPAPAPRFSRTSPGVPAAPSEPAADTDEALAAWGFSTAEIAGLREAGALG